ncbi:hypothetical protein A9267_11450 [Shewanella sp. UCD-FRSSP16_17]|nr:hypothetical protein A9267_11450 [Shewanella sp. UCD-FRSSP16_17]
MDAKVASERAMDGESETIANSLYSMRIARFERVTSMEQQGRCKSGIAVDPLLARVWVEKPRLLTPKSLILKKC